MQTTPRSARTSAPKQFSATFENQGSGTIYNTKYMFAIGKKQNMKLITMQNPLRMKSHISHTGSIKHNVLKCSLLSMPHKVMIIFSCEMQTTPRTARTSAPTQFSANFENQGSGTIYNTKYMLAIREKNTMR